MTMKRILPTKSLKSATNCRSSPNLTSIMPSLPVIYFAATTGWRTVLFSGQLKNTNPGGDIDIPPTNPRTMEKKTICKIVLRLVLLFILYRFGSVAGVGTALLLFLGYGVACFLLRVCFTILFGVCATALFLFCLLLLLL